MPNPRIGRRRTMVAYLIGAFGLAISAQISFLVPLRARELGAGFDEIGLLMGAGAFAAAALSVTTGAAIDRLGPKRAFVLGAIATAAVAAALMTVTDYRWLFVLQPLYGITRNLGWVASQGYITSFATDDERPRLTGRFSFFSNVGQMAGPVLVGGVASLFGFRYAFVVPLFYAMGFALLGLRLTETRTDDHDVARERQGTGVRSALRLMALRGVQVALLLSFVRLWVSHVYQTFFPVFLVDRGLDAGVVGTVMATSGLVAALMAPTTGWFSRRLSQQTITSLALACGALGLVLAPFAAQVPLAFAVPVLTGIGQGISLPLLMSIVTTAAPATQRGIALGLRGMVNQVASSAAPVAIGPLMAALGLGLGFAAGGGVAALILVAARVVHISAHRSAPQLPSS